MEALNEIVIGGKSPIFKKVSEISDISALSLLIGYSTYSL